MPKIGYCTRGGMNGLKVTRKEMNDLADELNLNVIDLFIPVPERSETPCKNHDDNNTIYWESETGSHGWCCPICGEVLQWG